MSKPETQNSPDPAPAAKRDNVSPMMVQYLEIKAAHPDCLLFYRMGDFYELFFEDAATAARALDITLTKRGSHDGNPIPMCGVPVHSADGYLQRLIRDGFRVAVCEQTEDPAAAKKRGSKSVVRREVVRLVTPGTLTEDALLDARRHNYLAALADAHGALGLAWLDMSTGDFSVEPVEPAGLGAALARLEPGELLVPERLVQRPDLFETFAEWTEILTPQPDSRFDSENGRRRLEATYGIKALDAFGAFGRAEIAVAGALLDYVELTQKGRLPRLNAPRRTGSGSVMEIDAATRRNLELLRTLSGDRKGSLLSVVDRTVTGAGARLLAEWLAAPLTEPEPIHRRLDMVGYFVDGAAVRDRVRALLRKCPDIERALSRITIGRGGPRDLQAIAIGLGQAQDLRAAFAGGGLDTPPAELERCLNEIGHHDPLIDRLDRALAPELPVLARDGGFIAAGYSEALDEQRTLRDESRKLIAGLEARYREETGVASLKVRHNNVLGYFVEVTALHANKLAEPFIHRQTMANAMRFTTVELGDLEERIGRAADKALAIELALFEDLVGDVAEYGDPIAQAARALARIDAVAGLAELAVDGRYCRPVVDSGTDFEIRNGRHPVVEAALSARSEAAFVANHCDLSKDDRIWLVTGPNMAGKSTFLRQNALIAILAQMGSFVPAEEAHIGIVDRLFSRVGAADDLARGRSTFMVEMVETAAILNQAGSRALVILDEIGRGTATFDGLSIAWATVEHLHGVNKCRALFATHYHELTALAARLDALSCHTMRVKEWQGDVVFLHEVAPGAADRSYGIHVAQLAGLPAAVIARAEEVLTTLEQGEQAGALSKLADDLPLFSAAPRPRSGIAAKGPSPVEEKLAAANPDALSPRDALELLYELRRLLKP
ncbi:MAG: DNA mismatch repair protein MutS [Alphaproteobacteria bacterium]|nr:DNA mismatch repair protein MutS [Alphaproteobacteria bacterium]